MAAMPVQVCCRIDLCRTVQTDERMKVMSGPNARSIMPGAEGQITLSSDARKQLGLDKGTTLIELVGDKYVVLLPEDQVLTAAMKDAREALARTGITVDDLKVELERLKQERFAKKFPDLA